MSVVLDELAALIAACPICHWHHVSVGSADAFGVVILQRGHDVGVWSLRGAEFVFRNVASWDVVVTATPAAAAHQATIAMAEANRWRA